MKRILFLIVASLALYLVWAQNETSVDLSAGWKFATGDHPGCVKADFDDSGWKIMTMDKNWELQGFDVYDGYAWYRIKVVIPSDLRKSSYLKDSIMLSLGKINNWDQSYLNGQLLGMNGRTAPAGTQPDDSFLKAPSSMYDVQRDYVLPVNDPRVFWDEENVIAIRVFDEGGMGGIYAGDLRIRMRKLADYLTIDNSREATVSPGNTLTKVVCLQNSHSIRPLPGKFTITYIDKLNRKTTILKQEKISVKPGSFIESNYIVNAPDGPNTVICEFVFDEVKDRESVRDEYPYILTPPVPEQPRINGPSVYGCRPDKPFLFSIPASGKRPMFFATEGLPFGLNLDSKTGIITGRVADSGEYRVMLIARNRLGEAKKELRIIIGDRITLTPPMGWNSWNCWGLTVDQEKVVASAKVFKNKGLADHGFSFINIDDGWQKYQNEEPKRDPWGYILPNLKFPNMKSLGDSIHSMGLKFGIYSSPGPLTCGKYAGSYRYETRDIESYSAWGVDYLKYDWCSYDQIAKNLEKVELTKPYLVMRDAMKKANRDITYSLCQYGMGEVWKWGNEVGGNLWRTTEDITDNWESLKMCGFSQTMQAPYAGPGHWNDPDMLVLGWVGWGPSLHKSRLTPDEQYTHMSLWCLLSAPLLLGCDLTRLDDFTLNLITNDEVLAIDQDALGQQATLQIIEEEIQVWVKSLEDGSRAVGVFNLGDHSRKYDLDLKKLGLTENQAVRDLWRQKDLGTADGKFSCIVPSHGVVLVRLSTDDGRQTSVVSHPSSVIRPGELWLDNNGVPINAHGGGMLFDAGKYYWFGEHKVEGWKGNQAWIGVHCYSSEDLYNWKDEGIALKVSADTSSEITAGCVLERPKVIYNRQTGKYVMWFHLELKGQGYKAARSGVAVADQVTGPYTYLESMRPNGEMARDMTLFLDDDGKAYHIYASEDNATLIISQLSDDFLKPSGTFVKILKGRYREAPAICKYQGKYFL
ncbi:MAG: family 43 glycosylhydrolase, partial [Bacteroidales bacterium]|nr:family 43 glycosylhydrolase [Bacteroidales bacterium]